MQAFENQSSTCSTGGNAALTALEPLVRSRQTAIVDGPNELYAMRADRLAKEFSLKAIIRGSGVVSTNESDCCDQGERLLSGRLFQSHLKSTPWHLRLIPRCKV